MYVLQFLSGGFVGGWTDAREARRYGMLHYPGQPFNVTHVQMVAP